MFYLYIGKIRSTFSNIMLNKIKVISLDILIFNTKKTVTAIRRPHDFINREFNNRLKNFLEERKL